MKTHRSSLTNWNARKTYTEHLQEMKNSTLNQKKYVRNLTRRMKKAISNLETCIDDLDDLRESQWSLELVFHDNQVKIEVVGPDYQTWATIPLDDILRWFEGSQEYQEMAPFVADKLEAAAKQIREQL